MYRDFSIQIQAVATYKSPAFREAYVRKYARDYGLDAAAGAKMLADEMAAADRNLEFFLAVSVPASGKDNLAAPDSVWKIYMEADGLGRLDPFENPRRQGQGTGPPGWNHFFPLHYALGQAVPGPLHPFRTGS